MLILIFVSLINIISQVSCKSEFCTPDEATCDKSRLNDKRLDELDEKYREFFENIRDAERLYVPCVRQNCDCYTDVIMRDLQIFKSANSIDRELLDEAKSRGTLYQSINGRLYREKDCAFPSRCAGVEHFVLKVAKNLSSDTEFVVNTRDYPQSRKDFGRALPIFSFSKTLDHHDIMYPAWSFWEGGPAISLYPRGLGRWDLHRKSLNESSDRHPWNEKIEKGFFRGSRTSHERDNLVLLSRRRPDLVDASYTKNQAWKSKLDTLGAEPADEVSLESHCRYKYLFNYRGVAASFRHKHLFLCGSLVLHVGDRWMEFYYDSMIPWIHYIPVKTDATERELEKLLNFVKDNDHVSSIIAKRGRDFVWNRLRMRDITCYWKRLLDEYTKILRYSPKLRSDLIRIDDR